jgi:pimeloyl-ACP methyl ester carboxylesterase
LGEAPDLDLVVSYLGGSFGKGANTIMPQTMKAGSFFFCCVVILLLVVSGCGAGGGGEGESGAGASHENAPKGTFDLPNGRSLYVKCLGSGSPTVVLEPGENTPGSAMNPLQDPLARQSMTCVYDRANVESSGTAPTPRTAAEIVTDLHQLLKKADVPAPYMLAGSSAGGTLVQLYARRYPDKLKGVVAMNPVPPADPWLKRVLPIFNNDEDKAEQAYYRGNNDESIDYLASSKELKEAPPPPHVPFEMLISTKVQCEGDPTCLKSYDVYEQVEREVAQQWPKGCFHEVAASHDIYADKTEVVVDAVKHPCAE